MSAEYDLRIESGTVVTGSGSRRANVYVKDGRIAMVGSEWQPARERFDASDLLVMPGMVDAHVHFMDPGSTEREDFPSGSAAAARAGVTSVVEHTHGAPVRTVGDLERKIAHLSSRSRIDFALAAHAWPGQAEEVADLWAAGVSFIKAFTCTTHGIPGHGAEDLQTLFRAVARAQAICLVHGEDEQLTASAEHRLRQSGRTDGGVVAEWRNLNAELVAAARTATLAAGTGARVVVAHASHQRVVQALERVRRAGGRNLWIETCPQYLTLLEEEVLTEGPFRKFTPPARASRPEDLGEMWSLVADGRVDYVASDHAPSTRAQKLEGSIWDVHFGLPGIDTTLCILLDAAHQGRLTYEKVVELYSEAPASIYGLSPRKGRLLPGADADVVLVDPEERWSVTDGEILSKARWSPFSGRVLIGRPVRTYLRGAVVMEQGRVAAEPGRGHFLPGPGAGVRDH
ncbi:MAG: dihydroorotase family protein [Candidatus Dormiibacterota bacterium]